MRRALRGFDKGARPRLGYYTAVLADIVGHYGRVLAYEADQALADAARSNLSTWVHVDLRHGDAATVASEEQEFELRSLGMTAIYSAVGIRDASMSESLGRAMQRMPYPRFTILTLVPHQPTAQCWLHGEDVCIQQE